jgi:hypothetical protein
MVPRTFGTCRRSTTSAGPPLGRIQRRPRNSSAAGAVHFCRRRVPGRRSGSPSRQASEVSGHELAGRSSAGEGRHRVPARARNKGWIFALSEKSNGGRDQFLAPPGPSARNSGCRATALLFPTSAVYTSARNEAAGGCGSMRRAMRRGGQRFGSTGFSAGRPPSLIKIISCGEAEVTAGDDPKCEAVGTQRGRSHTPMSVIDKITVFW